MATYKKTNSFVSGAWVKTADLKNGSTAKIVSETNPQPSQFFNKDGSMKLQDVCKVKFEGVDALNVSLNRATINGLVDAFGEDSLKWQGNPLTVETEKMRVGGRAVTALYLIPAGYQRIDDENGYAVIVKIGAKVAGEVRDSEIPVIDEDGVNAELAGDEKETNLADIPF